MSKTKALRKWMGKEEPEEKPKEQVKAPSRLPEGLGLRRMRRR